MTPVVLRFALPVLLVAGVMKPARAAEPPMIAAEPPVVPLAATPPARVWYGWEVLAADGAMVGLTAACLAGGGDDVCTLPILGYFVTGPAVHGSRSGLRAIASFGMRVALPFIGIGIGTAIANCPPRDPNAWLDLCGVGEAAIGALSGMAVAMAIDSIWAYEDAAPSSSPTPPRRTSWAVTPTLKVSDNSAGFGLAGRF
jgi:hypothetical protein